MFRKHHLHFSIISIGLALLSLHSGTWAGEERDVELSLIFDQEGIEIKTSACIRVREKVYGAAGVPWPKFRAEAQTEPETLLTETFAAIQNKDIVRMKELLHPQAIQEFQEQASAIFPIFEGLQLGDVWGYYRFADRLGFFFQVNPTGKPFFTDFAFVRDETGNFRFLGDMIRSLTLQSVSDWFQSDWGPAKIRPPVYCTPSLLKRMTHKVRLDRELDKRLDHESHPLDSPAELLLIGRNFTDTDIENQPYAALRDKILALKNALRADQLGEYFDGFTERGRKRVEAWFLGAQEEERRKYVESFLAQEPFYVFNADPLFVVYTRTESSVIQVLYFVRDKNGQFRWANAAYATIYDTIFKSRRFAEAASEEKPFDNWKIAKSAPAD